jgi:nucleoside-diphosphate-sugar epimerase
MTSHFKIAISGAAGLVGQNLILRLEECGSGLERIGYIDLMRLVKEAARARSGRAHPLKQAMMETFRHPVCSGIVLEL